MIVNKIRKEKSMVESFGVVKGISSNPSVRGESDSGIHYKWVVRKQDLVFYEQAKEALGLEDMRITDIRDKYVHDFNNNILHDESTYIDVFTGSLYDLGEFHRKVAELRDVYEKEVELKVV